jgi:hypothetical protein
VIQEKSAPRKQGGIEKTGNWVSKMSVKKL